MLQATAPTILGEDDIRRLLIDGLYHQYTNGRVLVLIPDHTRTLPLPDLFRIIVEVLNDVEQLDFMVALGTHPQLDFESLCNLVGLTVDARRDAYAHVGLLNHTWDDRGLLMQIGTLPQDQVKEIAGDYWHPSLGDDVPVKINSLAMGYDHIIILGPTFPHEVVGFSGGAKYLFPGISGPEMINVTHWLGALMTIMNVIGIKDTPVRDLIHAAADLIQIPITLISMVVERDGLAGMFIGNYIEAFNAAAELSAQRQITYLDKPVERVLSAAPAMYDELWTAAKAMYKLEPAIADGGEVVIYAPHLKTVSEVHGKNIYKVGYHVLDYFLEQWNTFSKVPKGVLAHSTHLKGAGTFIDGVEKPRIKVTLASQISAEDCATLNLGYLDPRKINVSSWDTDPAALFIPKAGEQLYRLKT